MKKTVKTEKKFSAIGFSDGTWWAVSGVSAQVGPLPSKSAAKKLADAFNREWRAAHFKPKSAGRRARTKGHSFEREVAIALRHIFPEARRHLEYQDQEANGIDLVNTGSFKIQCKKLKTYAPVNTIEEVQADRLLGDVPVLVTAADNARPMAVLDFEDFIKLVESAKRSDFGC